MKKRFGQHLLTDKNYLRKITENCSLDKNDIVVEIGAGSGLLTCFLANNVKKIYAVEIEKSILQKLKNNLKINDIKNVEVVEEDFLRLNISKLINDSFCVIGNIPYRITSKILIKLFGEIDKPSEYLNLMKKAYLMLQYEVAQRIVAKPDSKNYSPLSILVQYFTLPKILFKVPRGVFIPQPNVDSAFVFFNIKKELCPVSNPTFLKNLIRTGFQQRRKKLINALNKFVENKKQLETVFKMLNLNENLRAENLSFEDYLKLSCALHISN